MKQITRANYLPAEQCLNELIEKNLQRLHPYNWFNKNLKQEALEHAKAAVLCFMNGWKKQTELRKVQVVDCVAHDRSIRAVELIKRNGGLAKLFAKTLSIGPNTLIKSTNHDWKLNHIDSYDGLIPNEAIFQTAKAMNMGIEFDDFTIATPTPKPAPLHVPKPRIKDPILLGVMKSYNSFFLVEISRWD